MSAGIHRLTEQAHLWSPVLLATALVAASAVALRRSGPDAEAVLLLALLLGLRNLVREFVMPLRTTWRRWPSGWTASPSPRAGPRAARPLAARIATELEGRLNRLADGVYQDALTGLANRRGSRMRCASPSARPIAASTGSRCCSSTWTTSKLSTTASAMRPATNC